MKATECKCCKCGKQAVAFWPCIDPDIPSHPYCRPCLDREQLRTMIAIFGKEDGKDLVIHKKKNHKKPNKTKK